MANHVCADRIKEKWTGTGTGAPTLPDVAESGHFKFSAVCANNDTFYYLIAHATAAEAEIGIGTYNTTGPAFTRTTVIRSTNADAAVSFSAGDKYVMIVSPAVAFGWGVLTVTPSANQNNYAPTGLNYCGELRLNPSASILLTGLANGYEGREITLRNQSTDFLVILNDGDGNSTAANRFDFGGAIFLFPGDFVRLRYNGTDSRWQRVQDKLFVEDVNPLGGIHFVEEFLSGLATNGNVGATALAVVSSGTSAAPALSTKGSDTTEKANGVLQIALGTTTTGRSSITWQQVNQGPLTLGCALMLARVAFEDLSTSSEEYSLVVGWGDNTGAGEMTDGVYWEYRRASSGDVWVTCASGASTRTKNATNRAVTADQFDWLGIFINANCTRADFFYSRDGKVFAFANTGAITGANLPTSSELAGFIFKGEKSAGTTSRIIYIDHASIHYQYRRAG